MKATSLVTLALVLSACGDRLLDGKQITELQAKSALGPTAEWPLDTALPQSEVQEMRDHAYRFCLSNKASDQGCLNEQDHSLFQYANSFRLVRLFRSEAKPTFPYAIAHKNNPAAFQRVLRYCRSAYEDQGSGDTRVLGPCMSAGMGSDFFGVIPVS